MKTALGTFFALFLLASVCLADAYTATKSFTQVTVTATTTSTQVLPANAFRRYIIIQNRGTTDSIIVKCGSASTTAADGLEIGAGGGSYDSNVPCAEAVFIRSNTGTQSTVIREGV